MKNRYRLSRSQQRDLLGARRKLVVPRYEAEYRQAFKYGRYKAWDADGWRNPYQDAVDARMAEIRALRPQSAGDKRRRTVLLRSLTVGQQYRALDGHGKATGKRYTRGVDDMQRVARHSMEYVLPVVRQQETVWSELTRQRNRLHRLAMQN